MRHFVSMKFEPGFFSPAVFEKIAAAFRELQQEQNMDLMIEMTLRDRASLEKYLPHPIHRGIGEVMNPHVVKIASFDCD